MNTIKIIRKIIIWAVIVCCLALIGSGTYSFWLREVKGETCPTVFGIGAAVVVSGSMEDAVSINDFVVTIRQKDYEVGDIVMYDAGETPVTHRITEKNNDTYMTKGDANNVADKEPVSESRIAGKVVLIIPGVGVAMGFMQSPLGVMILILAAFMLLVMPSFFGKAEDE